MTIGEMRPGGIDDSKVSYQKKLKAPVKGDLKMDPNQEVQHIKQIDSWIAKSTEGLGSEPLMHLFKEAVRTLQKRTLSTLSDVTLNAVLDRALHQSQKKFRILSDISISPEGEVSLEKLLPNARTLNSDEIVAAFRFFLIELLTILSNLTAGIMTEPLYRELSRVTKTSIPEDSQAGHQSVGHSARNSKDREGT